MEYLSFFDYALIVLYFAAVTLVGIILSRKASGSIEDYFLGGRNLPWWALAFSGTAWWFSISGSMIIISFLYMLGPRGLYIEFRGGACLIMLIPMLWSAKWHRRSQCVTGAEFLVFRFGDNTWARFSRIVTAFAAVVTNIAMLGMFIKSVGLFISTFVPFTPLECEIIMVVIVTIYTVLSGFYGVVVTDMIQCVFIFACVAIISVMAFNRVGSADEVGVLAEKVTGASGWLKSYPQWKTPMPEGGEYQQYQYLIMFAIFYIIRNLLSATGAGAAPMYFGARSDRECGKLTFMWGNLMTFRWPMMMGFAVLGIYMVSELYGGDTSQLAQAAELVKAHIPGIDNFSWANTVADIGYTPEKYPAELVSGLQNLLGEKWIQKIQLMGFDGNVNPERILPSVVLFLVPAGARGLIIVTLLAAFMSAFDSTVNSCTAFFTRDLYQAFVHKKASNKELITVSWIFGIALVSLGWLFGYYSKSLNDIWAWIVMGIGAAGIVSGVLLHYYWRIGSGAFAFAWVIGLTSAVLHKALWPLMESKFGWPTLNEWQMFLLVMGINVVATIIGIILFPPADKETLEKYYKTVKPYGVWGPVKNALSPDEQKELRTEFRYNMLALPCAFVWLVTMFLASMQLIIHKWTDFYITAGLWLLSLVGLYFFWYKQLPPDQFSKVKHTPGEPEKAGLIDALKTEKKDAENEKA